MIEELKKKIGQLELEHEVEYNRIQQLRWNIFTVVKFFSASQQICPGVESAVQRT